MFFKYIYFLLFQQVYSIINDIIIDESLKKQSLLKNIETIALYKSKEEVNIFLDSIKEEILKTALIKSNKAINEFLDTINYDKKIGNDELEKKLTQENYLISFKEYRLRGDHHSHGEDLIE